MVDSPPGGDATFAANPTAVSLRIERSLSAPPERVWAALTDPAQLAAWFWPSRLRVRATSEPRPGGAFRIEGASNSDEPYLMAVSGDFEVVRRPDELAFSWRWDGDADETRVAIELSGMDDRTKTALVVTHAGFPDEATRDDHIKGWSDCLDRLPEFLRSGPIVDF